MADVSDAATRQASSKAAHRHRRDRRARGDDQPDAVDGRGVGERSGSAELHDAAARDRGAPRELDITNIGSGPLQVTGLAFAGVDPQDFMVTSDGCLGPVPEGQNCALEVVFAPQGSGARQATPVIGSNDQFSPAFAAVSGNGGELPQGPPGVAGATGPTGATGAAAAAGPAGAQGAAGSQGPTARPGRWSSLPASSSGRR